MHELRLEERVNVEREGAYGSVTLKSVWIGDIHVLGTEERRWFEYGSVGFGEGLSGECLGDGWGGEEDGNPGCVLHKLVAGGCR